MTDPVLTALDEIEGINVDDGTVTLSTGVVLSGRPVARALVRRLIDGIPFPKAPVAILSDGTEEENPTHPDHLRAVDEYYAKVLEATRKLMILLGTTTVSVPPEMYPVESDGWLEELRAAGAEVPDPANATERRWMWLELYAMPTFPDQGRAWGLAISKTAIIESEVMAAIATFRSRAGQQAALGDAAQPAVDAQDGDQLQPGGAGDD